MPTESKEDVLGTLRAFIPSLDVDEEEEPDEDSPDETVDVDGQLDTVLND